MCLYLADFRIFSSYLLFFSVLGNLIMMCLGIVFLRLNVKKFELSVPGCSITSLRKLSIPVSFLSLYSSDGPRVDAAS